MSASGTDPVRILVADDHALVRAGLVLLLSSQPGLEVVGEATDGFDAVVQTRTLKPDVVLMDIRMPGMDGLEATRRITSEAAVAAPRVVVLTTYDLDEYVYEALRAGSCGFLLKHAPPEELLLGVRAAADGGALLSPPVTARLIAEFAARRPGPATPRRGLDRLTARERDVFELVVRGRSNAEIAAELRVAETTVKTHLGHALDKLGLATRVAAVVFGYETGMVRPGER
jgi:DNA-binding NarL/FixJ family response regulator